MLSVLSASGVEPSDLISAGDGRAPETNGSAAAGAAAKSKIRLKNMLLNVCSKWSTKGTIDTIAPSDESNLNIYADDRCWIIGETIVVGNLN